jgi:hypothetical protein
MIGLLASLDSPPSGRKRAVWFDSLAYCRQKLLAGQPVPWPSPGELAAFCGKAQDMFGSDAVQVDLADLFAQRAADDRLRAGTEGDLVLAAVPADGDPETIMRKVRELR